MPERERNDEKTQLDAAANILRDFEAVDRQPPAVPAFTRWSVAGRQDWPALGRLANSADWGQPRVGDMPPSPPTLRARFGRVLVSAVRRGLFWYSDQIATLHRMIADSAIETLRTFETSEVEQQNQRERIEELERQMARLIEEIERLGPRSSPGTSTSKPDTAEDGFR